MKTLQGVITKISGIQTIRVTVQEVNIHPRYHKRYTTDRSFLVHTDKAHKLGDTVIFGMSKPISKHKTFQEI
ncbi:mitochondrial small ribosomal subunit protein uS17m [Candidatus Berkelbacteria bacterium]|nr:mitochondrial small ribosomal subunit protein uS17m [Candidatus Berkelbacteria bacterium]